MCPYLLGHPVYQLSYIYIYSLYNLHAVWFGPPQTKFLATPMSHITLFTSNTTWHTTPCRIWGLSQTFGSYFVRGVGLLFVDSCKNLGILVDTELKFHRHIRSIVGKSSRMLVNLLNLTFLRIDVNSVY